MALRKVLSPALSEKSAHSTWDPVLAHLAAPASSEVARASSVSRYHAQLESSPEWQAAWREAKYQKKVLAILSDLADVVQSWTDLSDCAWRMPVVLRRAEEHNMDQLEEVEAARDLIPKVEATQRELQAAYDNHELLASALVNATERGFADRREVQRCQSS